MLLFVSFFAGVLTVLAPCVLPLIPIIISGGFSQTSAESRYTSFRRIAIITTSLAASIFTFTVLLKASTALLGVPQVMWQLLSGVLLMMLGVHFLYPAAWQHINLHFGLALLSQRQLTSVSTLTGTTALIATGAALGPVFTSCSPVYALILAVIFPSSWLLGTLYLLAYILGVCTVLAFASYFGARLTRKLGWALNEHGVFRKIVGTIFVIVGISIVFGFDKTVQVWLLEHGFYDGTSGLEQLYTPKL